VKKLDPVLSPKIQLPPKRKISQTDPMPHCMVFGGEVTVIIRDLPPGSGSKPGAKPLVFVVKGRFLHQNPLL
jgi:hypothetical protein